MSLLLSRLCFSKAARVPFLILSNSFSSSLLQTPPCAIISADSCGPDMGKLIISIANETDDTYLDKKVPLELMKKMGTVASSNGWVATLKDDGILRLQDDLNPVASDTNPKRIPLPPLETLPHCQTKIITNVSLSSSSPEDEDCVVAVKFLGPQISFCRPAQSNSGWTNVRIENPCFYSSRVMFSKKDEMFLMPGSGGHLIGSWDLRKRKPKTKIKRLRLRDFPELTKTKREILHSCCKSEHLVESRTTDETFLLKQYKKATSKIVKGVAQMKTEALMVFKLDQQGNAVYTNCIWGLCIFLSKAEPFCTHAGSFPGLIFNVVHLLDVDETGSVGLYSPSIHTWNSTSTVPYFIPPQNILD
ncbi:uncharacterized protein LOC103844896 [Brassica rapa]|uniref:KIB1-4 beta-propeller domain-containing protein n=1 Tax=Brassica campestris TaxID=3711 RepID=M4CFK7_BRACM|nr:uncharacterized protein LOC103844896 [Brassica rapa]